MRRAL
jgi:hypothetical protein